MQITNPSGGKRPANNGVDRSSWVDSKVLFRRLGELSLACQAANNTELAIVLISGCIIDEVNTLPRIIGVLKRFNFKPAQVARILKKATGPDPVQHRWRCDALGEYRLHA